MSKNTVKSYVSNPTTFKDFLTEEVTKGVVVKVNFSDVGSSLIQALSTKQNIDLIKAFKIALKRTHGNITSDLSTLIDEFEDVNVKYSNFIGIEMYDPSKITFSIGSANGKLRIRGTDRERDALLSSTDLDSTIRDLIDSIPSAKFK